MKHPQYAAILAAMQNLKPTMQRRAKNNGINPYLAALSHEWVNFLQFED